MNHVGLIVKVTRICNLRCTYCHDWASSGETMSFATLARLTAQAMAEYDHVDFIWHGGETTAIPLAFYQKAMMLQARFLRPGCRVQNSLQTNGTRVDDTWASFFKAWNFSLGVSVDGPRALQDRKRRYVGGKSSYDDVLRGIAVLRRYQIPVGVLMVIDEDTLALGPDRLFEWCLENGIKRFGCLAAKPPCQPEAGPGSPAPFYVDPPRMMRFLRGLYDRWLAHGDPEVEIREISGLENRLGVIDGGTNHCSLEGDCLGKYYLVEPSGQLEHCDLFLGDSKYAFGNIHDRTFGDIDGCGGMRELRQANAQSVEVMRSSCPEFRVCNGWCPHERYISYRHNLAHSDECCGLRELIEHIRANPRRTRLPVLKASAALSPAR